MSYRQPVTVRVDSKAFVFETGCTFRGLTISQRGAYFRIFLRVFLRDGTPAYYYVDHEDIEAAMTNLLAVVTGRGGASVWRFDSFYSPNGANTP